MLKMIIVDDEDRVRDGLKRSIEWVKYGIKIIGTYDNGKEALEVIKKEKPEIILTDIYMPEMDGLELVNHVSEIIPHAKSIIMSGYKDFEYAQTAIRNKAFDYILKPIELDYLIETVQKAKNKIEDELSRVKNKDRLQKQFQESLPVLRERYLDYILTNRLTFKEVQEQYGYIKLKLKNENFAVLVVELEDISDQDKYKEMNIISLKNATDYIVNNNFDGEVIIGNQQKFVIIVNYDGSKNNGKILEYIQTNARKIQNHIDNMFGYSVSVGIGGLYKQSENISTSYREALEALEYRIFMGKGQIIYIGDVTIEKNKNTLIYPINKEEQIITSLKVGDKSNIQKQVKEMVNYLLQKKSISPEEIKKIYLQLIYTVLKNIIEWDLDVEIKRKEIEEKIASRKTSEELEEYIINFLFNIVDNVNDRRKDQNNEYIKKTCQFIEENYQNDISLQDIGNYVYITPQYLSKIFKEQVGKTVINYFIEFRMCKAKELLLNTNLKVYEIAKKVGYSDSRYFSRAFKKHEHISPNKYRNIK